MTSQAQTKLKRLFHTIARTTSEAELRTRFIDTIGIHFQAQRWGIYLYSPAGQLNSVDIHGIRSAEAFVERYQSVGRAVDPVLRHVETYHAPAHEGLFYTPSEWQHSDLYTRCCAMMDHAHLMTGPLVGNGQMIGAVHFSKTSGTPAFTTHGLLELGAVCAHISAQLAAFKPNHTIGENVQRLLTPRERQVAELVASGLTNAAISRQLWITENTVKQTLKKIFRKLKVPNRAAMVAKLRS